LSGHEHVRQSGVGVIGVSKGGEIALHMAFYHHKVRYDFLQSYVWVIIHLVLVPRVTYIIYFYIIYVCVESINILIWLMSELILAHTSCRNLDKTWT